MSRRKANVSKRTEYVDDEIVLSEEKITPKSNKRKLKSQDLDDSNWIPVQKHPKMMRVNRKKPQHLVSSDDEIEIEDEDIDSIIDLDMESKNICTNRNALIARRNRIKKKMYLEKLEETSKSYKNVCNKMQQQIEKDQEMIKKLEKENKYLRNVITNSSGLKQILHGVRLAGIGNHSSNQHSHSSSSNSTPSVTQESKPCDATPLKVNVTDDNFPSSTTCDMSPLEKQNKLPPIEDDLKWMQSYVDQLPSVSNDYYSSNPQLFYDLIQSRRKSSLLNSQNIK